MKKLTLLKSRLLLLIWCSYLGLSCVPEKDDRTLSIETTVSNIQKRLKNKDYPNEVFVNPRQDLMKEMKRALLFTGEKFDPKLKKANTQSLNNGIFRFASIPNTIDEFQTFGIDDPENFNLLVNEISSYYTGVYTHNQVVSNLTNLNNLLLNYPYTYYGADRFLIDQVNNGNLTPIQAQIVRIELEAIINATSVNEISNIVNVVTQEVLNSQLTYQEQNTIHTLNAGVEALMEYEAIAKLQNELPYHFAAEAFFAISAAIAIVGAALIIIGAMNDNSAMAMWGGVMAVVGWGWMLMDQ